MLFILFLHFAVHGTKTAGYVECGDIVATGGVITNSFFVVAVNCFLLISGFFGIKAKWRNFFHLYMMCAFYAVSIWFVGSAWQHHFSKRELIYAFLPFSHTELWFVPPYLYLFLLSPLLNKAVEHASRKELAIILSLCSLIVFYFGFHWKGEIDENGYNFINFAYLYLIGRFIALHTKNIKSIRRAATYLGLYLFTSSIIAMLALVNFSRFNFEEITRLCHAYNSPLIIASSIFFFLFFNALNIQSKAINWIASSVFAVYLIHEKDFVAQRLYKFVWNMGQTADYALILGLKLFLLAILIIIACVLIDKFRMFFTSPLERWVNWEKLEIKVDKILTSVLAKITP